MELTIDILIEEAKAFSQMLSAQNHSSLIGVTDGKAVGTYVEHLFQNHLSRKYTMTVGSSASGIDLPSVNTDIKTTSYVQPQSSCPFKSARQKIFGLGYNQLLPPSHFGSVPCAAVPLRQLLHLFAFKKDPVGQPLDNLICIAFAGAAESAKKQERNGILSCSKLRLILPR